MSNVPHGAIDRAPREHMQAVPSRTFGGIQLGRIDGIEVRVDWSLIIIFALVTISLGTGALPRWHPEWSSALRWFIAACAAILFFGSVLLHELSHALVGRRHGVPVQRITLFIFGGVAHLERDPTTPRAELFMAAVGPLTSIGIGLASTLIGLALASPAISAFDTPELAIAAMSPLATLLLWLGPINLFLGIFNLVPGFPLDGGRVLRAALWWTTGDIVKATRWATAMGRAVGFVLIGLGVLIAFGFRVAFFGRGLVSGLWLVLIGWFLHNAARASYQQLLIRRHLTSVPVREVMRPRSSTLAPGTTLSDFVRDYVMASEQTSFPVVDGDALVGVIAAQNVRNVPRDAWSDVTVAEVMTPADASLSVDVNAGAEEALDRLVKSEAEQLPVLDHGALRGFVWRRDILKWLSLQPIEAT
jgi:Zn-dependent protease/predicted transcriptional regulator